MADKTELDRMATDLAKADKTIAEKDGNITALEKRIATLEADLRSRDKDIGALKTDFEREVAKNADPEDELLKGMNEPARKAFLAQKAETDRLRKRLDEEDAKAKEADIAKSFDAEFPHLPVRGKDIASVLKAVYAAVDSDGADKLRAIFKAGSEALHDMTRLRGLTNGVAPDSTEAEVDKQAKALAAKDHISYAKAYSQVLSADPGLYTKMRAEAGQTQ